jgi:hypothetical protein
MYFINASQSLSHPWALSSACCSVLDAVLQLPLQTFNLVLQRRNPQPFRSQHHRCVLYHLHLRLCEVAKSMFSPIINRTVPVMCV